MYSRGICEYGIFSVNSITAHLTPICIIFPLKGNADFFLCEYGATSGGVNCFSSVKKDKIERKHKLTKLTLNLYACLHLLCVFYCCLLSPNKLYFA